MFLFAFDVIGFLKDWVAPVIMILVDASKGVKDDGLQTCMFMRYNNFCLGCLGICDLLKTVECSCGTIISVLVA